MATTIPVASAASHVEDGGVCLFACPAFDCSRLGNGWECRDRDRVSGGQIHVCFGN
jgi:hypothetical protein